MLPFRYLKTKLNPFEQIRINNGIVFEHEKKENKVLKRLSVKDRERYFLFINNVPIKDGEADLSEYKTEYLLFFAKNL